MPKYIEADWLIAEANMDGAYGYVGADQIAKAPADHVVEVVRCKDCKHYVNDRLKKKTTRRTSDLSVEYALFRNMQNCEVLIGFVQTEKGEKMSGSCKVILNKMVYKGAMTVEERDKILRNLIRHGKWVLIGSKLESRPYSCSECNYAFQVDTVMGKTAWRFCPNCGARMESE